MVGVAQNKALILRSSAPRVRIPVAPRGGSKRRKFIDYKVYSGCRFFLGNGLERGSVPWHLTTLPV